jgi:aldehyde dehydrogenase (NAD+)
VKSASKEKSEFKWDYAPAPESKDHIKLDARYELFINGEFVKPLSKKYFNTYSPSTEQKLAAVAQANEKDVNAAVLAARHAYDRVWKKMPAN